MKYIIKQIFIIALFLPNISFGIDGNLLLESCLKADRVKNDLNLKINEPFSFGLRVGTCIGLIQGTISTINVLNIAKKNNEFGICFPEKGIHINQSVKIVIKYLKANPETLHIPHTVLIILAFKQAFPCK